MPQRKGQHAPQNTFLDTIGKRFCETKSNFILGNAPDPGSLLIIYCSDGFCDLTGYQRSKLMQKSCRCFFLYGKQTTSEARQAIKNALDNEEKLLKTLILYKKNKEPFHCLLDIVPIKNDQNKVVMFLILFKTIPSYREDMLDCLSSYSSLSLPDDLENEETNRFEKLGRHRKSFALLYNLSENLKAKKTKKTPNCLKVFSDKVFSHHNVSLPQYKVDEEKSSHFALLHFGATRTVWDWFVVLITLYIAISVPLNAAVQTVRSEPSNSSEETHHAHKALMTLDLSCEAIFILDIILSFFTTYTSKSGVVIFEWKKIAIHYLTSWFVLDVIAAIPVDIISHLTGNHWDTQVFILLKTLRMIRLVSLYYRVGNWSQYSALVLSVLMLAFLMVAHWLACIWLAIGWAEHYNKDVYETGWLHQLSGVLHQPFNASGEGGPSVMSAYVTSLYFTLSSMTSVGFGNVSANTNKEKVFSICIMAIGALMHAVVFGNVTAIIQRMYARSSMYDMKIKDLKDFIKAHKLSKFTKSRMIAHFESNWEANGGVNADEVLKDFSEDIRADVALQIYKDVLEISSFQNRPKGFRRHLSLHIYSCKHIPGDVILHDGDPLVNVTLVCKGSLEVMKDGKLVGILGRGDLFGAKIDTTGRTPMVSHADVKATAYCELQCIRVAGIHCVMDIYPECVDGFIRDYRWDLSIRLWKVKKHCDAILIQNEISCSSDEEMATKWENQKSELSEDLYDYDLDSNDYDRDVNSMFSVINEEDSNICDETMHLSKNQRFSRDCKLKSGQSSLISEDDMCLSGSEESRHLCYRDSRQVESNQFKSKKTSGRTAQSYREIYKSYNYLDKKKEQNLSKIQSFTKSLNSLFSKNGNNRKPMVYNHTLHKPTCFKKSSLVSLQTGQSQNSLYSDSSTTSKKVTFVDSFENISDSDKEQQNDPQQTLPILPEQTNSATNLTTRKSSKCDFNKTIEKSEDLHHNQEFSGELITRSTNLQVLSDRLKDLKSQVTICSIETDKIIEEIANTNSSYSNFYEADSETVSVVEKSLVSIVSRSNKVMSDLDHRTTVDKKHTTCNCALKQSTLPLTKEFPTVLPQCTLTTPTGSVDCVCIDGEKTLSFIEPKHARSRLRSRGSHFSSDSNSEVSSCSSSHRCVTPVTPIESSFPNNNTFRHSFNRESPYQMYDVIVDAIHTSPNMRFCSLPNGSAKSRCENVPSTSSMK